MEVVAIVLLARSVEDEAPLLAAELGLTAYEVAMMLRAPLPVIILRSEDRSRVADLVAKLRGRGHDALACDVSQVVPSTAMFRPKSFRLEGNDLLAFGEGEERRLQPGDVLSLVRAMHATRVEEVAQSTERKLSLGRAAMTGGLLMTRTQTTETKRIVDEREAVLYVFRRDTKPWLLHSTHLRYDGLGPEMRRSKMENFEVLVNLLRRSSADAHYDVRLLSVRVHPTARASPKSNHVSASSSGTLDLLAHIVTVAAGTVRPYR